MGKIDLLRTLTEISLKQNNGCIRVEGHSMNPLIRSNDVVLVEKCNEYKTGDIVVAIDDRGRVLVHRIVKINDEFIYIKGDHALSIEKVELKNCLGRVVEIKNGDKTINLKKRRITDKIVVLLSKSMNRKLNRTLKIKIKDAL